MLRNLLRLGGRVPRVMRMPKFAIRYSSEWKSLNTAGLRLAEEGSYVEAEDMFTAAVQEAQGPAQRCLTLSNLGNLRRREGRLDEARGLFEQSIGQLRALVGVDPAIIANCHRELGLVFQGLEQAEKAEHEFLISAGLYEQATKRRQDANPASASSPAPWAREESQLLFTLATMAHVRQDQAAAAPRYERALQATKHAWGATHPNVAEVLSSTAALRIDERKFGEAKELYQASFEMFKEAKDARAVHSLMYYLGTIKEDPASTTQAIAGAQASLDQLRADLKLPPESKPETETQAGSGTRPGSGLGSGSGAGPPESASEAQRRADKQAAAAKLYETATSKISAAVENTGGNEAFRKMLLEGVAQAKAEAEAGGKLEPVIEAQMAKLEELRQALRNRKQQQQQKQNSYAPKPKK